MVRWRGGTLPDFRNENLLWSICVSEAIVLSGKRVECCLRVGGRSCLKQRNSSILESCSRMRENGAGPERDQTPDKRKTMDRWIFVCICTKQQSSSSVIYCRKLRGMNRYIHNPEIVI
ncbi:hypothetical protein ILYODFUR_012315 [Ilyodon furcidens]|uniref:Uncharacterized protein n=1 Tax=Ilyodon furcidens TaxID=33524 RepID=A0ABV0T7F0_9TELE